MSSYDQKSLLKAVKALNIGAITSNTTTAGSSIDTKGFESLTLFVELGARTDGSFLPLVQDSDDNTTFDILLRSASTSASKSCTLWRAGPSLPSP